MLQIPKLKRRASNLRQQNPNRPAMDAQRSESTPQLPDDVIEEIMMRGPMKTVGRFRCVSVSMRSLLSSRRFITQHLRRRRRESPPSLMFNLSGQGLATCKLDSTSCQRIVSCLLVNRGVYNLYDCSTFPLVPRVLGCIDGLICFHDRLERLCFWNPSKSIDWSRQRYIAFSRGEYPHPRARFRRSTGEFKIFVVKSIRKRRYEKNGSSYGSIFERKVYSSRTKLWRSLGIGVLCSNTKSGVLVSGKLHWERGVLGQEQDIVWFDIHTEAFGEMELPLALEGRPRGSISQPLATYGGRLSWLYGNLGEELQLWVMLEYGVRSSWTRVFNLQQPFPLITPFCIGPWGDISVFVYGSAFLAYIPMYNAFRFLGNDRCFLGVYPYVESLVTPYYAWRDVAV